MRAMVTRRAPREIREKSFATTLHSPSGERSVVCPGPCSVGRGTNAVQRPWPLGGARVVVAQGGHQHHLLSGRSPGRTPSAVRYASGARLVPARVLPP